MGIIADNFIWSNLSLHNLNADSYKIHLKLTDVWKASRDASGDRTQKLYQHNGCLVF